MYVNLLSSFYNQIIAASLIGNLNFFRKFKARKSHERIFDFDVEENCLFSHHESFFYSGFDKIAPVVVVRRNYKIFFIFLIFIFFVILTVLLLFVFKVFSNNIF